MVFTRQLTTSSVSALAALFAMLLFAFWQQWIIIRLPQKLPIYHTKMRITKKKIMLWFWQHTRWQHEEVKLLWSTDTGQTVTQIINALLIIFDEEGLLSKKTTLQTATIDSSGTALLSFNRAPINKQSSVFTKWMMIESILKTLRENKVAIQAVQFLTHQQPMHDAHLDFSHPWPLSGFLSTK